MTQIGLICSYDPKVSGSFNGAVWDECSTPPFSFLLVLAIVLSTHKERVKHVQTSVLLDREMNCPDSPRRFFDQNGHRQVLGFVYQPRQQIIKHILK